MMFLLQLYDLNLSFFYSALNGGAFELQNDDMSKMVDYALTMLARFLNSNAELRLDESFTVYFKVLSVAHVNYPYHRRKQRPVLGCRSSRATINSMGKAIKRPGCLDFPDGYPSQPTAFKNKCLLTALLAGHAQNHQSEEGSDTFKKIMDIFHYKKENQENAGILLNSLIVSLTEEFQWPLDGPYEFHSISKTLSQKWDCQIHLIANCQQKKCLIYSVPSQFNDAKEQIYLLETSPGHVVLIQNIKTFFNNNRRICFYCKRTFSKSYDHICTVKATCRACHKILATRETKMQKNEAHRYCKANIEALPEEIVCQLCNLTFKSIDCYESHKKDCNKRLFRCETCQQKIAFQNQTLAQAKEDHTCGQLKVKCAYCHVIKEENHQCKLYKAKFHKVFPNLCFFNFEFTTSNSDNCFECYKRREEYKVINNLTWKELYQHSEFKNLFCSVHSENPFFACPNVLTLLRESSRGVFDELVILDQDLQKVVLKTVSNNDFIMKAQNALKMDCYGEKLKDTYAMIFQRTDPVYRNKPGMTQQFTTCLSDYKLNGIKTVLQKFIYEISQEKWRNYTFITFSEDVCQLQLILEAFLNLQLQPGSNLSYFMAYYISYTYLRY